MGEGGLKSQIENAREDGVRASIGSKNTADTKTVASLPVASGDRTEHEDSNGGVRLLKGGPSPLPPGLKAGYQDFRSEKYFPNPHPDFFSDLSLFLSLCLSLMFSSYYPFLLSVIFLLSVYHLFALSSYYPLTSYRLLITQ